MLVVFYEMLATTKDNNEKTNEFPVEGSVLDSGPEHWYNRWDLVNILEQNFHCLSNEIARHLTDMHG